MSDGVCYIGITATQRHDKAEHLNIFIAYGLYAAVCLAIVISIHNFDPKVIALSLVLISCSLVTYMLGVLLFWCCITTNQR